MDKNIPASGGELPPMMLFIVKEDVESTAVLAKASTSAEDAPAAAGDVHNADAALSRGAQMGMAALQSVVAQKDATLVAIEALAAGAKTFQLKELGIDRKSVV